MFLTTKIYFVGRQNFRLADRSADMSRNRPQCRAFSYVGFCQDALCSHGWSCELGSRPPRGAQAFPQPEWSGVAGGAVRVGSVRERVLTAKRPRRGHSAIRVLE